MESDDILEEELTGLTNGLHETRFLACANKWMSGRLALANVCLKGALGKILGGINLCVWV